MEYLKSGNKKETKFRIKEEVYFLLEKLSQIEGKSINLLVNEILENFLSERFKGPSNCNEDLLFSEKPLKVYNKYGIEIYQNDFLKVDFSDYKEKIDLVITSPPYNLSVEYGKYNDSINYEEYLKFTELWLKKVYFLLKEDGRICLNIPLDKNKNGQKPVYADIVKIALDVGFKYQSTIVWNEQNISRRTAWGSWLSASAPYVIAPVEMIVLLYKKTWKKKRKGTSTITREEFINWTNGVWTFSGESKKRVGHPAPFPLELPRRCIRLFSYKEDVILDPFLGSGTTAIAGLLEGRRVVGVEINPQYIELAIKRIINTVSLPLKF
jgi:site-specific DNA-methyltransferase (adenine-specific)